MPFNFYAVAIGGTPGIYDNWPEAQKGISGLGKGAKTKFKGFDTRADALEYMNKFAVNYVQSDVYAEDGMNTIYIYSDSADNITTFGMQIITIEEKTIKVSGIVPNIFPLEGGAIYAFCLSLQLTNGPCMVCCNDKLLVDLMLDGNDKECDPKILNYYDLVMQGREDISIDIKKKSSVAKKLSGDAFSLPTGTLLKIY